MNNFYRHPRTLNEMKQYEQSLTNELNIQIKIRAKRRPVMLPTEWDDIWRPWNVRCWKNYRDYQWRSK